MKNRTPWVAAELARGITPEQLMPFLMVELTFTLTRIVRVMEAAMPMIEAAAKLEREKADHTARVKAVVDSLKGKGAPPWVGTTGDDAPIEALHLSGRCWSVLHYGHKIRTIDELKRLMDRAPVPGIGRVRAREIHEALAAYDAAQPASIHGEEA